MQNGSSKTYVVSGETTEWDDILIKKGITTKESVLIGKGLNPLDVRPRICLYCHFVILLQFVEKEEPEDVPEETFEDRLKGADLEELDELEVVMCFHHNQIDLFQDDFSDDRLLQVYREQRLKELQIKRSQNRFGSVNEISKGDWISEVTEGSKTCNVIAHLYDDSVVGCQLMDDMLSKLAPKFPETKFVRIRSTHAIENWPTKNLPTVFVYQNGDLFCQLLTLYTVGGNSVTPDGILIYILYTIYVSQYSYILFVILLVQY